MIGISEMIRCWIGLVIKCQVCNIYVFDIYVNDSYPDNNYVYDNYFQDTIVYGVYDS